jgi:nucleoside-triphosphatase
MEKILLIGQRRSGRSSMIRALLRDVEAPVFGYETVTMGTRADGYHEIYLYPYGQRQREKREENHVGDCNTRERILYPQVFDTLGTSCLTGGGDGILVMDEIGFMESDAAVFCRTILDCLDGPLPVLAAVRTGIETPFLRRVTRHPKVRCVEMEPDRFDEIYMALRPVVQSWDLRLRGGGTP